MQDTLKTSKNSSTKDSSPSKTNEVLAFEPLKDKVFGVLVSAATFNGERLLLLRRSLKQKFMPGAWSIPAGKIQPGEESLEDAALRELNEEAGLTGRVVANLGMTWFESVYYQHPLHHIQFNFVVTCDDPRVELLDHSNMDYLWLPMDQAEDPPVEIDEFTRGLVTRAIDYYRKAR